jgi:hypothetical protein
MQFKVLTSIASYIQNLLIKQMGVHMGGIAVFCK